MTGLPTLVAPADLDFDVRETYAGCRVCGALFQTLVDRFKGPYPLKFPTRVENDEQRSLLAMAIRKKWSVRHAKEHTEKEHLDLALSGMWCTPLAATIFASYGILAMSDLVMSEETADALLKASAIPIKEVETASAFL